MRLLLDTHVLIWWFTASEQLSQTARRAISDQDSTLFVSVIAGWEYMMKLRRGTLPLTDTFEDIVRKLHLQTLDLEYRQHLHAHSLPAIHRDPFDRMMVAQAIDHNLTFVTSDDKIRLYPVPTLW